jgi:putative hydrolase of the HAD superfamily
VIRAVYFDVDDTLVDFDASALAAFREIFGADADYAAWLRLSAEHYPRYTSGELDFTAMREARMAAYLELAGQPMPAEEVRGAEQRRMDLLDASYALFDDALDCLDQLRARGLLLGLITNNESVHQRRKLVRVGLADRFDAVLISGECGVAKPERAIFDLARARLSVSADEAVHVGDNLLTDVRGALDAGFAAVWLNRRRPDPADDPAGEAAGEAVGVPVIGGLAELPALLLGALRRAEEVR